LTNFACGACIQVVKTAYIFFDAQNKQELYFSSKMKNQIWIKGKEILGLGQDGGLAVGKATDFIMARAHEGFSLSPTLSRSLSLSLSLSLSPLSLSGYGTSGGCLELYDSVAKTTTPPMELVRFRLNGICSTSTRQAFNAGDIPGLLANEVLASRTEVHLHGFTKTTFFTKRAKFNCKSYGVGTLRFKATGRNTFTMSVACHPASVIGKWSKTKPNSFSVGGRTVLNVASSLAGVKMECGAGQGLSYIKKHPQSMESRCHFMTGMGSCHIFFTAQADITKLKSMDFVDGVSVTTAKEEVLQMIVAERSGDAWFRYRYSACIDRWASDQHYTRIGRRAISGQLILKVRGTILS